MNQLNRLPLILKVSVNLLMREKAEARLAKLAEKGDL